jgi:PAS domain S-box-containing protein
VRDDKGEYSARAIVDKAVALSEGEIGFISYRWKNIGDNDFRAKIAAVAYYEPWDWVIGTSIYEDEIETYSRVLALGRRRTTRIMAAIGAAIACVVGFSGFLVSRRIFAPLEKITASAEALAAGGTNFEAELLSGDEVGILSNAFMRMARRIQNSLKELRESEEKYRSIYENSVDGIFRTNMSGMILHANPALARILGFESPEELLTRNLNVARDVYADAGERDAFLRELLDNGVIHGKEVRIRKADGSVIWVSFSARTLADEKGLPTIIEGFLSDITEKHQAEGSLRKSLKKSELLLREVHHRVKNNLQLLSSLLSFKASVSDNKDSSDFYAEFAVRIGSMAHIHEQLFGLAESSDIDLADFTRSIASYLYQEHRQHFSRVSIRIDAEPVRISLERATPYGLLIGEVLSNAFLHAFPLGLRDEGTIAITIQSSAEGSVEVVIADDGVGLPSSVDPVAPERLGFAVVQMLVSQLEADMEVRRGLGTTFRIRFMRDE